jgi:hypothetical protein
MITETLRTYERLYFRQEKCFRDVLLMRDPLGVQAT